eukprot:CAMPEP_0119015002 /NCGR_PEP_ID=MMETSP1176-20130426/10500_1 /TAXON_ID=265551 /ORGANISM="Synedropsis recta cf, Strain CCMP1620" /LENGTH=395 /DNA_ID=CAMNT_0006968259 /DNA_START=21 /DNA_END=1208 /DNA_ORIENTATION=+
MTMAVTMTTTMRLVALWLTTSSLLMTAHAFPVTSSRSSKKNRARPNTGGGAGFGNKGKTATLHDPDTSPEIASLMNFLIQKGSIGLNDVGLEVGTCKTTGRRGLYCTTAYNKGEIVCQIPSDLALALSDPTKLTASTEEVTMQEAGCNFLEMYVKDPQAQQVWKPYLDSLPTSALTSETPDFYNEEELALLEFPRIMTMAKERKQELQNFISTKGDDSMTLDELQFATWLVSSRAIQLSLGESSEPETDDEGRPILKKNSKKLGLMIPFIDLANHSSNQPNACLHLIDPDKDDAWFALKATRNISAGKELVHSYGSGIESTVELLGNYGMVPDENKVDAFMWNRGGDDTEVEWSTTLEEDELMLKEVPEGSRLQTILQFRARLKRAQQEVAAKAE